MKKDQDHGSWEYHWVDRNGKKHVTAGSGTEAQRDAVAASIQKAGGEIVKGVERGFAFLKSLFG